jgi:2-phosphosulfolactate phosphatase
VLPSPNGSTIAAALDETDTTVAIGCLRNAQAVGVWLADARAAGHSVTVVAAGERQDGQESGRAALEDILGAGAIMSSLAAAGADSGWSRPARSAAGLFEAARGSLAERLRASASGRELIDRGFGVDVDVAAELDVSSVVPVLAGGAFVPDR